MSGSITVRLGARALKLVRARARARKVSTSDVVRELIEGELQPQPQPQPPLSALELSRAWVGALRDANLAPGAATREALETWDPDRR